MNRPPPQSPLFLLVVLAAGCSPAILSVPDSSSSADAEQVQPPDGGETSDSGALDAGMVDGGSADSGGTDAGLMPTVEICAPTPDPRTPSRAFIADAGSDSQGEWVAYACAAPCTGSWESCTHAAYSNGQPWTYARGDGGTLNKLQLEFVVDQMAGSFVFTPDGNDAVLLHSGTGGTDVGKSALLSAWLEQRTGARTVHVVWENGSKTVFAVLGGGWWTRKDAQPVNVPTQTRRPGAAIDWVARNFATGHKLGTVGCSLGTMATLAPVLWGSAESHLDYQMVMGGSVFWDVNATCGRTPVYAVGHCDTDARPCHTDTDCVGGPSDHCRAPTDPVTAQFPPLINYLYKIANDPTRACFDTRQTQPTPNPELDASSFSKTAANWNVTHPLHFVTDEDGVPDGGPDRPADQTVMEGSAMYAVAQLRAADAGVSWSDFNGYFHCDSFGGDPSLVPWTGSTIQSEMGLQ